MKTIIFALAALLSTSALAEAPRFVSPSGCVWKDGGGTCMVTNVFNETVNCDVTTKVQSVAITGNSSRITDLVTRVKISIPPKMTDNSIKIAPTAGQRMTDVQISAVCTAKGR